MYILGNLLLGLASVANSVLFVYTIIIIASAVISWVNADPNNQIVRIIHMLTEPVYKKLRQKIPTTIGGLDLTPVILLLLIQFIQIAVISSISMFGFSLVHGA